MDTYLELCDPATQTFEFIKVLRHVGVSLKTVQTLDRFGRLTLNEDTPDRWHITYHFNYAMTQSRGLAVDKPSKDLAELLRARFAGEIVVSGGCLTGTISRA